jgi:hypothetical protein
MFVGNLLVQLYFGGDDSSKKEKELDKMTIDREGKIAHHNHNYNPDTLEQDSLNV